MSKGNFFFQGIRNTLIDKKIEDSRIDKAKKLLDSAKKAQWFKVNSSAPDIYIYKSKDNKMYVFKGGENYVLKGLGITLSLDKVKVDENGGMTFKKIEDSKYKNISSVSTDLSESTLDTEEETEDFDFLNAFRKGDCNGSDTSSVNKLDEDFDPFANIPKKDDNKSYDNLARLTGITLQKRLHTINKKKMNVADKLTNTVSLGNEIKLSDDLGIDLSRMNLNSFNISELVQITYDLIKCLKNFADKGAVHGDIKLENILIKRKKGVIKATLIDPMTAKILKVNNKDKIETQAMKTIMSRYSDAYDKWKKDNKIIIERNGIEKDHSSPYKADYFCIDLIFHYLSESFKKESVEYKFLDKIIKLMDENNPIPYLLSQISSFAKRNNYALRK